MTGHSINLWHCIQLSHTAIPSTKPRYMDCIIREVTEIELHSNSRNREDGFCLSKSWEPLICSLKIIGSVHHMTADLCSLRGHADLCTLPLSGHNMCPLWAPTNLHPDALASFHYLSHPSMPVTHSLDLSPSHVDSFPNTPLHFFFLTFFLDQQNYPLSGPSYTSLLVSYWFAWWLCEKPEVSFCPTGKPMRTEVHSSISLPFPI
jgi:hypothetical protein